MPFTHNLSAEEIREVKEFIHVIKRDYNFNVSYLLSFMSSDEPEHVRLGKTISANEMLYDSFNFSCFSIIFGKPNPSERNIRDSFTEKTADDILRSIVFNKNLFASCEKKINMLRNEKIPEEEKNLRLEMDKINEIDRQIDELQRQRQLSLERVEEISDIIERHQDCVKVHLRQKVECEKKIVHLGADEDDVPDNRVLRDAEREVKQSKGQAYFDTIKSVYRRICQDDYIRIVRNSMHARNVDNFFFDNTTPFFTAIIEGVGYGEVDRHTLENIIKAIIAGKSPRFKLGDLNKLAVKYNIQFLKNLFSPPSK